MQWYPRIIYETRQSVINVIKWPKNSSGITEQTEFTFSFMNVIVSELEFKGIHRTYFFMTSGLWFHEDYILGNYRKHKGKNNYCRYWSWWTRAEELCIPQWAQPEEFLVWSRPGHLRWETACQPLIPALSTPASFSLYFAWKTSPWIPAIERI